MFDTPQLTALIDAALAEDIGLGDVTTQSLVGGGQKGEARVLTREALVVAGAAMFTGVFRRVDATLQVTPRCSDGDQIGAGEVIMDLQGSLAAILMGERVALNFFQRLCGIATLTRRYVDNLPSNSSTIIVDTRKTTPGLRALERLAVRCGGGHNHRPRLDGGILIKDNHIAVCGSLTAAVEKARAAQGPALRIEVEVTSLDELDEALAARAEVIMLDNMALDAMAEATRRARGKALIEVSGGVTADQVRAVAELGVDFISVGALTHSARAIDLSLKIDPC